METERGGKRKTRGRPRAFRGRRRDREGPPLSALLEALDGLVLGVESLEDGEELGDGEEILDLLGEISPRVNMALIL